MPLRDEYPGSLEPAGDVTAEGGVYDATVDREAAEEAYHKEVGLMEDVDALRDSYYAWAGECPTYMGGDHDEERTYQAAVTAVRDGTVQPAPETVRRFCERYSTAAWDGFFISAMVNESPHDTFSLPDMDNVSYLGYRNVKDVTVEGDVKNAAGIRMQDGRITVRGDADTAVGKEMAGGVIELHGEGDIAVGEEGYVENVNGTRHYAVSRDETTGLLDRIRTLLEDR